MVSPDSPPKKWSRLPPEPVAKSSTTGRLLLLIALGAALLGFATYRFFLQPTTPARSTAPPAEAVVDSGRMVSLFYPLADGSGLASTILKRPACQEETACREDLLLALSENPGAGSFSLLTLPNGPPAIDIDGATATINFSRETIQHLPGGVQSERLVLAALANTLAVNYPQVQQLSIEIDGVPAETLKGHIDLSTPFAPDFSLVRRPLLPSFPIQSGNNSERSL
ncbi:MAG: GerMN domain-containing protein [Desulfuromonadales bacterium]|nr:GerMN domain-containing protein [Desulfuromonadales bacterium]